MSTSVSLRDFLLQATKKTAEDLKAAVERVPEEKRDWSPMDRGRTALDQAAECALLNGMAAEMIRNKAGLENFDYAAYQLRKAELAKNWATVKETLEKNTEAFLQALSAADENDYTVEIQMLSRRLPLAQVAAYPYWNMSYHEGQINYIASMLGCL